MELGHNQRLPSRSAKMSLSVLIPDPLPTAASEFKPCRGKNRIYDLFLQQTVALATCFQRASLSPLFNFVLPDRRKARGVAFLGILVFLPTARSLLWYSLLVRCSDNLHALHTAHVSGIHSRSKQVACRHRQSIPHSCQA